jgi:O-antigen/teichoic acid export membrane protein
MKWNSFLKNIGIYTLSNVLNAAIPFILLPVLTQHLSTSDYGVISNYNALINILIPFIGLNLMAALQVVYVKNKNEI